MITNIIYLTWIRVKRSPFSAYLDAVLSTFCTRAPATHSPTLPPTLSTAACRLPFLHLLGHLHHFTMGRSRNPRCVVGQYKYRGEEGKRETTGRERGHWDPRPFQVIIKMALLLPSVFLSAFPFTQLISLYSFLSSRTHVRSFYTLTNLFTAVRYGSSQSTAASSTTKYKLVSPLYLHEEPALSSRILQYTLRED